MMEVTRCAWVNDDPLYIAYHDEEWGKPLYGDQKLFELLMLEGMQAGLSWYTVLKNGRVSERYLTDLIRIRLSIMMKPKWQS